MLDAMENSAPHQQALTLAENERRNLHLPLQDDRTNPSPTVLHYNHSYCKSIETIIPIASKLKSKNRLEEELVSVGDSEPEKANLMEKSLSSWSARQQNPCLNRHQNSKRQFSYNSLVTRLKRSPSTSLHLLPIFHQSSRGFFKILFLFALLFSSLLHSSAAQNGGYAQQESLSKSTFQSWIIGEISSDEDPMSNTSDNILFQLPDFVIPTGRLFQYQIPNEAFSRMDSISYFQV